MSYKRKQIGKEKEKVVFPIAESLNNMPKNYQKFIEKIKDNIKQERIKAHLSANSSMILMYWNIGNSILEQQNKEAWGTKVIDRMSQDLKDAFPDITGFSTRNLKYMRKFADAWKNIEIVQRTVAQIPWRSNITLLDKLSDPKLRLFYAQKTIENGFGKDMLVFQIESQLHKRKGNSVSNFKQWQQIQGNDAEALEKQIKLFIDPVSETATTENMVYELLLKSGKDLNIKIEHKDNYYCINNNELILMLEKATQEIVDNVIAEKPQKVVALDRLFKGNDQLKTNTFLQMKDAEIEFKTI